MAIGGKEFIMDKTRYPLSLKLNLLIEHPSPRFQETISVRDVLIDTGSTNTALNNDVVVKLKLRNTGKTIPVAGYDDIPKEDCKIYHAKIIIEGVDDVIIEVMGWEHDTIIGMDLITRWNMLIDSKKGVFEIVRKDNYQLGK